jgi:type III secretion protein D
VENKPEYTLFIESGLYAGVTRDLQAGYYVIGSRPPADIVLMEDDLSETHAALSFAKDKMQIEALADNVSIDGRAVANGEKVIVTLPSSFSFGGIKLKCGLSSEHMNAASAGALSKLNPLKAFNFGAKQRSWLGIGALGIACLLFMGAPIIKAIMSGSPMADPNKPKISTVPAKTAQLNKKPITPQEIKDATDKLRRDMARFLSVRVNSEGGTVVVSGNITPADADRWKAIAQKFDDDYAGRIELVSQLNTSPTKDKDIPKIDAYWTGSTPYIIVEGRKYFVGSKIEPGWIFESIQDNLPQLERGGRKVIVQQNQ